MPPRVLLVTDVADGVRGGVSDVSLWDPDAEVIVRFQLYRERTCPFYRRSSAVAVALVPSRPLATSALM